jgi:hypothetical protein
MQIIFEILNVAGEYKHKNITQKSEKMLEHYLHHSEY